jgi:hypothetical protein
MGDKGSLKGFLTEHADKLRQRWHDAVVSAYPPETVRFLRSEKDQIANPVGYTIKTVVEDVIAGLSSGASASDLASAVHPLIRIKAVQGFAPSEAVSCVLELKRTVKGLAGGQGGDARVLEELDLVIDEMLCSCFDLYTDCRQKLHEIKEDELKRNLYMLLRKSDLVDGQGQGEG